MSMIEVASAVSDCGSYMIASEEVTPDEGWNHVKVVNALNKSYELPTADIAQMIASKFVDSYRRKRNTPAVKENDGDSEFLPVTMNAINLAKAGETVAAINDFVKTAADPVLNPALTDSLTYVQRFNDPDYVDLIHFVDILSGSVSSKPLAQSAAALKQKLSELILKSQHNSPAFKNARGISIYFPAKDYDNAYDGINFSKICEWNQFIKSYLFPKNSEVVTFENCLIKSANNDGRISPNDTPELVATILNTGSKPASNCRFTLSGKNAGIKIISSEAHAAEIKPGERVEVSFKISAISAKAGQKLSFDLNYTGANAEMTVKIATLALEVKQPFVKTSNLLLILGTIDQPVEKQYSDSLAGLSQNYDIWRTLTDGPINAAILNKYINGGTVFRIVPDSSIQNKITRDEVLVWESYLKKGGSLLITGQDVGAMISETPLYINFLKCNLNSDSGGTTRLLGMDIFEGKNYSLNGPNSADNQIFLDDISPRAGATPIFKYDNQKVAGVFVKTPEYRIIYLAFGLEAVAGVNERAEIISTALKLLPFSLETGLDAVSDVSSSKSSPEAALTNIERTRESIVSDLNESKYSSAEQLASYVSGLDTPGAKEPFKPVLKTISEMLRSKL
ncbi:MAG TPA: clostripain-related cysteine peptidase, partial [Candidatus Wallbacteria bacterium]|nr:clostripain-related cysteine peptidase [Candidatus Wallbacteria bacterium]